MTMGSIMSEFLGKDPNLLHHTESVLLNSLVIAQGAPNNSLNTSIDGNPPNTSNIGITTNKYGNAPLKPL